MLKLRSNSRAYAAAPTTPPELPEYTEKIIVTAQFKHYMKSLNMPKSQDFDINEVVVKKHTFVEMQGRARSKKPH